MTTLRITLVVSGLYAWRPNPGGGTPTKLVSPGMVGRRLKDAQYRATVHVRQGAVALDRVQTFLQTARSLSQVRYAEHFRNHPARPFTLYSRKGLTSHKDRRTFAQEVAELLTSALGAEVAIEYQ